MSQTDEIVFDLEREITAIASALGLPESKVKAAAELLGEGNTIPFVARYRKERTGGLDETALRSIEDAIDTLRELIERKNTVLKTIAEQGKLDVALREKILACREKKELEELYLPYKPKRRTRAAIARERGLEGLAAILKRQVNPGGSRAEVMRPYINPDREVPDAEAALQRRMRHRGRRLGRRRGGPRRGARGDEAGHARLAGPPRLGRQAEQVRDVLRLSRAAGQNAFAPFPGHAPRRGRRSAARGDRDRRRAGPPPLDRPPGHQPVVPVPARIEPRRSPIVTAGCCFLPWNRRCWRR